MTSTGAPVALIACGAVAQDTAAIVKAHGWRADVHGISSDLHMTPLEIGPAVEAKLQDLLPRYERVITRAKRLKAHDETNASKVGDRVLIEETRPLSKDKRWQIRQVLGAGAS